MLDVVARGPARPAQRVRANLFRPVHSLHRIDSDGDVELSLDGHLIDRACTLHGVDPTVIGLSALSRIGILAEGARARAADGRWSRGIEARRAAAS